MSSTDHCIGFGETRSSSRILKPPGGGHSNIFSEPEQIKPHARPKYDQQNSSNLNFCMNTVDPNEKVAKKAPVQQDVEVAVASNNVVEADAPQPAKADEIELDSPKQPSNLPNYHHHRSTALW